MIEFEYIYKSTALVVSADHDGEDITDLEVYTQDGEEVTLPKQVLEEIYELALVELVEQEEEEHGACFGCAYC